VRDSRDFRQRKCLSSTLHASAQRGSQGSTHRGWPDYDPCMARKLQRLTVATALLTLALSGTASATILTSAPREDLVCGDAIEVGIWENPNKEPTPRGQRKVTMRAIDTATGKTWWKKTATATHKWRYWYLPSGRRGRCGTTTVTLTYRAFGRKIVDRATVHFRSEGD
jgi:hypothetical protein